MYNLKALAVAPERSKGATKGLRVINSCVLKSNFLDHRRVLVPLAAAVTPKHCENVAVISSSNNLLYLMCSGSQLYVWLRHLFYFAWSRHLFYFALEAGIYVLQKTRDLLRSRGLWEIEPLLIANHVSVFYLSMV